MRCKFYGLHPVPKRHALCESGGNQCGLIIEALAPCRLEVAGQEPIFENCEFYGSGRAAEFDKFERYSNPAAFGPELRF